MPLFIQVNAQGKLGATPLMVACSGSHLEIVGLLIENHADVNCVTPEGWSALHVAVWASAPSVVKLLLSIGANPDVQVSQEGLWALSSRSIHSPGSPAEAGKGIAGQLAAYHLFLTDTFNHYFIRNQFLPSYYKNPFVDPVSYAGGN